MASYVAIDFETANEARASACSVGVVRVDDSKITQQWTTLIDPETYFVPMNVAIHGIKPQDVRGAPTFPSVLEQILEIAEGTELFVAHSAAFDMQVLTGSAARYGTDPGVQRFACTKVFSRRWFPGWSSYSLDHVVNQLGLMGELGGDRHHEALWDAAAAARIAEYGLERDASSTWAEAADAQSVRLGTVRLGSYQGCVSQASRRPARTRSASV